MYRNIQPLQAEQDLKNLRLLRLAGSGATKELINDYVREQELELERVLIPDREAEYRAGRAKLKELAQRIGGG